MLLLLRLLLKIFSLQLSKLSEIYYRSQQNKYPENLATIYFYNLSPLVIITLMSIFISVKESIFLYLYNIIPLLFFFNLILWTFTHIALYCKTKIADQTNWTQSTFFEIWNKFCKIVPILITIQTTEEKQYLVIWAYCTIELVATEVKTLKFKTF